MQPKKKACVPRDRMTTRTKEELRRANGANAQAMNTSETNALGQVPACGAAVSRFMSGVVIRVKKNGPPGPHRKRLPYPESYSLNMFKLRLHVGHLWQVATAESPARAVRGKPQLTWNILTGYPENLWGLWRWGENRRPCWVMAVCNRSIYPLQEAGVEAPSPPIHTH